MHLQLPLNQPLTLVERQMAINYLQTDDTCCFDMDDEGNFCIFTPIDEKNLDSITTSLEGRPLQ